MIIEIDWTRSFAIGELNSTFDKCDGYIWLVLILINNARKKKTYVAYKHVSRESSSQLTKSIFQRSWYTTNQMVKEQQP